MKDPLIPTPLPRRQSPAPGTTLALIAPFADLALTVGLGVLRTTNSQLGQRRAEGLLPTFAFAIVLAAAGIVALIGVAIARPVLFGAAAIGCLPLAVVSIASRVDSCSAVHDCVRPGVSSTIVVTGTGCAHLRRLRGATRRSTLDPRGRHGSVLLHRPGGGSESGGYILQRQAAWSSLLVAADLALTTTLARQAPQ